MAAIRGKETAPELLLRRALHRSGYRYRLHVEDLAGRPDLVLPRYRAVIFVHGCFWHRHRGCVLAYEPKSRARFWTEKFSRNVQRDRRQIRQLRLEKWRVLVVWECGLRRVDDRARSVEAAKSWIASDSRFAEIRRSRGRAGIRRGSGK